MLHAGQQKRGTWPSGRLCHRQDNGADVKMNLGVCFLCAMMIFKQTKTGQTSGGGRQKQGRSCLFEMGPGQGACLPSVLHDPFSANHIFPASSDALIRPRDLAIADFKKRRCSNKSTHERCDNNMALVCFCGISPTFVPATQPTQSLCYSFAASMSSFQFMPKIYKCIPR